MNYKNPEEACLYYYKNIKGITPVYIMYKDNRKEKEKKNTEDSYWTLELQLQHTKLSSLIKNRSYISNLMQMNKKLCPSNISFVLLD